MIVFYPHHLIHRQLHRSSLPAVPNDPPQEEQEWVTEEAEEEEVLEEDEVVEVEAEAEPEFPDFPITERGREVSTRRRRPKKNRSNPHYLSI